MYRRFMTFIVPILGVLLTAAAAHAAGEAVDVKTLSDLLAKQALQVDKLWVLVSAALVMLMQAGFLALEIGSVRTHAAVVTAMKNIVDWVVCALFYFLVGWGLMFGHTKGGWFGGDFFMLQGLDVDGNAITVNIHFLFQLVFAATAATIISGAVAERTSFFPYMLSSIIVTAIIYPLVGHWAWGDSYFGSNETLLTKIGFIDFAGSTVVHSTGGWISLIAVAILGPRLGRFSAEGEVIELESHGLTWTAMGVILLWFGWWGFNGGSTLAFDETVGVIILNTNIAASAGGLAALGHAALFQGRESLTMKFLGGVLAGLVGITANCHMVTPADAIIIGAVAGVIANIGYELLLRFRLDDPVGAIPVHLLSGIWGTLAVGLFGDPAYFTEGFSRTDQIFAQVKGIAIVGVWCLSTGAALFLALRTFVGLRVSPTAELAGHDIAGAYLDEELDEAALVGLLGGEAMADDS